MLKTSILIARIMYRIDLKKPDGDTTGEGSLGFRSGRMNRNLYQLKDAYVVRREVPIIQFQKRTP